MVEHTAKGFHPRFVASALDCARLQEKQLGRFAVRVGEPTPARQTGALRPFPHGPAPTRGRGRRSAGALVGHAR